jgi:hypothetical protein
MLVELPVMLLGTGMTEVSFGLNLPGMVNVKFNTGSVTTVLVNVVVPLLVTIKQYTAGSALPLVAVTDSVGIVVLHNAPPSDPK